MVKLLFRSLFRSIKKTFGRYIAILAIIFLGVGFFSGIKSAKPAMALACDTLFNDSNMYDYTISSTLGLTEDDVKAFDDQSLHKGGHAEGNYNFQYVGYFSSKSEDSQIKIGNELAFSTYSYAYDKTFTYKDGDNDVTYKMEKTSISKPIVKYGRLIENDNECLLDSYMYSEKDIGSIVTFNNCKDIDTIDNERDSETKASNYTGLVTDYDVNNKNEKYSKTDASFKVVGIVQSPRYISKERGNTPLLLGNINSFIYLPKDRYYLYEHDPSSKDTTPLNSPRNYTEILYSIDSNVSRFDDDYTKELNKYDKRLQDLVQERVDIRYNTVFKKILDSKKGLESAKKLLQDYYDTLDDENAKKRIQDQINELDKQLVTINEQIDKLPQATGFALSLKDSNESFINFDNQIQIISTVADVFPVIFVLIAALVCVSTMKRMVNDERGEIATYKAMGYSNTFISLKYIIYTTSAAIIGAFLGFFLMTLFIPKLAWLVYSANFVFTATIPYYFSPLMFILCIFIAIIGAFVFTYLPCLNELRAKPADGMRPKAPKPGKKMFVEKHMPKLWSKLSFMSKCITKNMVRYKNRLFMFIVGIAGCTMLIVMGFGFNDSISNMGVYQYEEIQKYDGMISYIHEVDESKQSIDLLNEGCDNYISSFTKKLDFTTKNNKTFNANLVEMEKDKGLKYVDLHKGKTKYDYPSDGECVITKGIAEQKGIRVKDTINVSVDGIPLSYNVTAICDNYMDHYVYISSLQGVDFQRNTIYLNLKESLDIDENKAHDYFTKLRGMDNVANILVSKDLQRTMQRTFDSITIVIIFIIAISGALCFIVLYNLTNINIIERTREIATIQVLGFNKKETSAYVLRENIILSVFGAIVGLPLGYIIFLFIMKQISMPNAIFDIRINVWSYLISFTITIIFAIISNLLMKNKLNKINMAESLKSVE